MKSKIRSLKRIDFIVLVSIFVLCTKSIAQTGQINISRVTQMPNLPAPYLMRDWKTVALQYDELIFSSSLTGQYLPLMQLKSNGSNYPSLQPILLDTYVGSLSDQAEAINIIPALVGATLIGIDKSDQDGINWTEKAKDFFNKANGQNVYLNGYAATSGTDWWYDVMPNVFFYQLYSQYPDVPDFDLQFNMVADRWLSAIYAMGASTTPWKIPAMNYRGWYLNSMTPNNNGVIEPEAAGSIAWLLYHAWIQSGNKKYLTGAQLAMDFLANLNSNPSYELQLPYGVLVAAKMNAELGAHYDLEKMVNWCFDKGPLRNWGVIAGTWNGADVSGLIGEANDSGNDYAFAMNGFQQAAALVPMVKYDKRFARDIAKWILNLANASRLYYPQYLPEASQDDFAWSALNDSQSVIAYEALKENQDGKKLYGTGDAKKNGWAQTNLGIYGSSHVGYLGAIIESTDVEGILKVDINKTDFFGANTPPAFLLYNPHADTRQVTLSLGTQMYDLYNAISETIIKSGVTGNTQINIAAGEAMLLVYLPQGSTLELKDGKLYLGDTVVDYHYGYNFEGSLRIKSISVNDTLVEFNEQVSFYSTIENVTGTVAYNWYVNGVLSPTSIENFSWNVPEVEGTYKILLEITSGLSSAKDSITMTVVENIPVPPIITGFTTDKTFYYAGGEASLICKASNQDGGPLLYTWESATGIMISQNDSLVHWSTPGTEGLFEIFCTVTNSDGLKAVSSLNVLVQKMSEGVTAPYAYYPLDGNVLDFSGNGYNAILEGAQPTSDARNEMGKAYKFSSSDDIIFVPDEATLNFQDQITVSFWVKLDAVTQESFILSHGSWEERWKVSVTPEKKLRWTIKTSSGTKDLDSSFPLQLNHYYHFAVVYTGYTLELYSDGVLDTFIRHSGAIATTHKAITFGRKDVDVSNYAMHGSLDEVRIYDKALAANEIATLQSLWSIITDVEIEPHTDFTLYPNPSQGVFNILGLAQIKNVDVWDMMGRKIKASYNYISLLALQVAVDRTPGIAIVKIETSETVYYRKIRIQ
jgi:hypothetical protein